MNKNVLLLLMIICYVLPIYYVYYYYKNLEENDIRQSINVDEIFSEYEFQSRLTWPQDLYFWGVKK